MMKKELKRKTASCVFTLVMALVAAAVIGFTPRTTEPAYATSGDSALNCGTAVLEHNMNTSRDKTQIVWYAGKSWFVIGYDGKEGGAASKSGTATLFSTMKYGATKFADKKNYYETSLLKKEVDNIAGTFSFGEQGAIDRKTLVHGVYDDANYQNTDCISGEKDIPDVLLWPLTTKEAYAVKQNLRIADPKRQSSKDVDWWLCSPGKGEKNNFAAAVRANGEIDVSELIIRITYGVRPAFNLNLESVLFTSAAESGKSSGSVGADALKAQSGLTNSGNEWKVTVKDYMHSQFAVSDVEAVENGVKVNYTDAVIGSNEHISAVITDKPITDSSAKIIYYGRVKYSTSYNDTVTINMAGKLRDGDYLYVFNEQHNKDKETDYASELWEVTPPEYTWSDDNSTCTASMRNRKNPSKVETETVTTTSEITKPATCTEKGETTYTAEFTNSDFKTQTRTVVNVEIDPDAHDWKYPTYEWSEDYSKVTATRVCKYNDEHKETETVTTTSEVTKESSCTEKGTINYTAVFTSTAFRTQEKTDYIPLKDHTWGEGEPAEGQSICGGDAMQYTCNICGETIIVGDNPDGHEWEEEWTYYPEPICIGTNQKFHKCKHCDALDLHPVLEPGPGHDWSEPDYKWSENKSVTATHFCKRDNCGLTEGETVETTSRVTKEATCTEKGETTYTAEFDNSAFMTQSKTEADIDALGHDWDEPTYEWAADNSSVTATRVCKRDTNHKETETAKTTSQITREATCTEKGETTYTAEFENSAFRTQSKSETDVDALGHDWGNWTKLDAKQHQRVCKHNKAHVEKANHKWDAGKVTRKPTETAEGVKTYTCTVCKATRTESIPKVKPSKKTYHNTEGNNQVWHKGSKKTADFVFKRAEKDSETFSHFIGIMVDGNDVDESYYTAEPGSVIIKLKPKYLEKLESGEHELTAVFDDGSASVTFSIADNGNINPDDKKSDGKGGNGKSGKRGVKTGDSTDILMWLAMMLGATLTLTGTAVHRRKKRS